MKTFSFVSSVFVLMTKPGSGVIVSPRGPSAFCTWMPLSFSMPGNVPSQAIPAASSLSP